MGFFFRRYFATCTLANYSTRENNCYSCTENLMKYVLFQHFFLPIPFCLELEAWVCQKIWGKSWNYASAWHPMANEWLCPSSISQSLNGNPRLMGRILKINTKGCLCTNFPKVILVLFCWNGNCHISLMFNHSKVCLYHYTMAVFYCYDWISVRVHNWAVKICFRLWLAINIML